ncbi:MAG: ATP synthase F1 subunit epsilon [Clostridia bacterium]|nr:ATP synthase F1 subunit epsilon [Clostridia bacterium]
MSSFNLKVVASDKVFFDGKCKSLIAPLYDGKIGILAHHSNAIMAVETGEMKIIPEEGDVIEAFVSTGFMEILDGDVTICVISAERPEDIDEFRARQAKERAEEELRQQLSIREYYKTTASLARATERMKVKKKYDHMDQ